MPSEDQLERQDYPATLILRNNTGMIRDCYWDGDYFVIRQIMADPQNGIDGVKIKAFRFDAAECELIREALGNPL